MLPRKYHPTMSKIRELFKVTPKLTAFDIECQCFIDARNAREYLKILHKEESEIRVIEWRRDSIQGKHTPVYTWGPGEDVKKPEAKKSAQSRREHRAKEGVWDREKARARARRALPAVMSIKSPLSASLFGM